MRRKGSGAEWERLRLVAANMFDREMEPATVAPLLGISAQTARAWRRTYRAGGRVALASRKPPGRPALLDDAQRGRLAEMLERTPGACGFAGRYLWTTQLVADLIAREFGVTYHHDHVGLLLGRLGFTHQRPARRAKERDAARVEAWRREAWPALLKKAPTGAG